MQMNITESCREKKISTYRLMSIAPNVAFRLEKKRRKSRQILPAPAVYPFFIAFTLSNICFIVSTLLSVKLNGELVNGWK